MNAKRDVNIFRLTLAKPSLFFMVMAIGILNQAQLGNATPLRWDVAYESHPVWTTPGYETDFKILENNGLDFGFYTDANAVIFPNNTNPISNPSLDYEIWLELKGDPGTTVTLNVYSDLNYKWGYDLVPSQGWSSLSVTSTANFTLDVCNNPIYDTSYYSHSWDAGVYKDSSLGHPVLRTTITREVGDLLMIKGHTGACISTSPSIGSAGSFAYNAITIHSVPEPSSLIYLGLGLAWVIAMKLKNIFKKYS